jgi:hypothetical protein
VRPDSWKFPPDFRNEDNPFLLQVLVFFNTAWLKLCSVPISQIKERDKMHTEVKNQALRDGLRSFGLDPSEWQVQDHENGQMVIHHRKEQEFKLLGKAYATDSLLGASWYWSEISFPIF